MRIGKEQNPIRVPEPVKPQREQPTQEPVEAPASEPKEQPKVPEKVPAE